MIAFAIAGVLVVLLIAGAVAGGRRHPRPGFGGRGRRGAGFGYIAPRDLIKYK